MKRFKGDSVASIGAAYSSSSETMPLVINSSSHSTKKDRLISLDAMRGITIFCMLVANNIEADTYEWLDHAFWNGLHFADFVMPNFLWIVGASMTISFRSQMNSSDNKLQIFKRALWRSTKLFLLGMFLQGSGAPNAPQWPRFDLSHIRIFGVLQRIGFAFAISSAIALFVPTVETSADAPQSLLFGSSSSSSSSSRFLVLKKYSLRWLCAVVILVLYCGLLFGLNVPGCGRGSLSQSCNAPGYIDYNLLGFMHMYANPTCKNSDPPCPYFDPEGLTTSVVATLSVFFGMYVGYALQEFESSDYYEENSSSTSSIHSRRLWQILPLSTVLMIIGLVLHFTNVLPFNKNLYTPSYIFFMAGFSGYMFALMYYLMDMKRIQKPFNGFTYMGMNSIALYLFDGLIAFFLGATEYSDSKPCAAPFIYWGGDRNNNIRGLIWKHVFASGWMDMRFSALLWSIFCGLTWMVVAWLLFRQKKFYKI